MPLLRAPLFVLRLVAVVVGVVGWLVVVPLIEIARGVARAARNLVRRG